MLELGDWWHWVDLLFFGKQMVTIKNPKRKEYNQSSSSRMFNVGGRLMVRCHFGLWKVLEQKTYFYTKCSKTLGE